MIDLTKEDKEEIKAFCVIFNASRLWIDGVEVNVPINKGDEDGS